MHRSGQLVGASPIVVSLLLALLIILGSFPSRAVVANDTKLYVGHHARLSARIPAHWTVPADGSADYRGDNGFVFSAMLGAEAIEPLCVELSHIGLAVTGAPEMTSWNNAPACRVTGDFHGYAAAGLVFEAPEPTKLLGESYRFVVLVADPEHLKSILDTVNFDPGAVSPQNYIHSVLELLEARAWYAPEVNWDRLRTDELGLIENAETYADIHWVILDALSQLRAWGDNHSFFSADDRNRTALKQSGTGMQVMGQIVLQVFPDSQAGHAGIRVGDTIVSVDGMPFRSTQESIETAVGTGAPVEIRRAGVAESITVEIVPGPYSTYLPPIVAPVSDGVGYVELFPTIGSDPLEYVSDANAGIARFEESATCGWIVDLRRNGGGSYSPMVMGVASILGDGPLISFERRDGTVVERIELRDEGIYRDGLKITGYLGDVAAADLHASNPPVAVLIGPGTGSAGEVTAVAFVGRPDTKLFGETSAGATIGNTVYTLFDGSTLALAESTYVDRTGGTHIGGIEPDVTVATEWETYGTTNDPVIQAASAWLREHPGCDGATPVS